MGRWAQAQRRGTATPVPAAGYPNAAPTIGQWTFTDVAGDGAGHIVSYPGGVGFYLWKYGLDAAPTVVGGHHDVLSDFVVSGATEPTEILCQIAWCLSDGTQTSDYGDLKTIFP